MENTIETKSFFDWMRELKEKSKTKVSFRNYIWFRLQGKK